MLDQKMNNMVNDYLIGDELALEELCRKFLPIISKHSEDIWYRIENQGDFECRCLLKIKAAIKNFDPSKGSLVSRVIYVIKKEKYDFLSRRKRKIQDVESMDKPLYTDKDGNEVKLEVQDVLADVEDRLIEQETLNEKAALLAKGDSRRMAILKAWISGESNDLNLAKELATTFPKVSEEGHRKFIQRFRIECQERLATVS